MVLFEALAYFAGVFLFALFYLLQLILAAFSYLKGREFNEDTGRELDLLTGQDANGIASTDNERISSAVILWFRGDFDVKKFAEKFSKDVVYARDSGSRTKYARLLELVRYVNGFYYWSREKKFDINEHVIAHDKVLASPDELKREIAELLNTPLPSNKSPWFFHHFKLPADQQSALVFVYGHTVLDGTRFAFLLDRELAERDAGSKPGPSSKKPRKKSSANFLSIAKKVWRLPYEYFAQSLHTEVTMLSGCKITGKRVLSWSQPIKIEVLEEIAESTGCTADDVIFASLSGVLKKFFKDNEMRVPATVRLSLSLCRQNPNQPNYKTGKRTNVMVDLPLDKENRLETVNYFNSFFSHVKTKSLLLQFNQFMISKTANTLPSAIYHWLARNLEASLIGSTVQASPEQLTINGCQLEGACNLAPYRGKAGGSVSIMTYNGSLRLGVAMDTSIVSDVKLLDAMMEDLQTEVAEMADELKVQHQASK